MQAMSFSESAPFDRKDVISKTNTRQKMRSQYSKIRF